MIALRKLNVTEYGMLKGRHVIEPENLSVQEIDEICSLAEQIIVDPV